MAKEVKEVTAAPFMVGDEVVIARQPKNQWVRLVGVQAKIAALGNGFAHISGPNGEGTVPVDCLERVGDDE